jgi:hypothetical protein
MRQFPEWAPPSLVEHYHKFFADTDEEYTGWRKTERAILARLLTDPEMEGVWKRLFQNRKLSPCDNHRPKSYGNENSAMRLFFNITDSFSSMRYREPTRTEEALKYQAIAKAAREFAGLIEHSRLDETPYRWFPLDAIQTIIGTAIKPEKMNGYFSLARDEVNGAGYTCKKGAIYNPVKLKDLSGNDIQEFWWLSNDTTELFYKYLMPQYPVMSGILKSLADEADKLAREAFTRPRLAERPSVSDTTIFIRALSDFWINEFQGPLYRTFAALCRVVLDDKTIGEDTIKEALKGYKGGG